jgi:nicotinamidase-related amidase
MAELRIDPAKTALVLIDLQNMILSRESAPYPSAQVVENSRKLAKRFARKAPPWFTCELTSTTSSSFPLTNRFAWATGRFRRVYLRLLHQRVSSLATF